VSSYNNRDYLTRFLTGGYFKVNLTNRFGIKTGLQYEENGWAYRSINFEGSNGSIFQKSDVLYKLNYLSMQVLAEHSFGEKTIFYTNAGLFFSWLLNSKIVQKRIEPAGPDSNSRSNSLTNFNAGIALGAGVQIPVSKKMKLYPGLINQIGLVNINKPEASSKSSLKTNSFAAVAGVSFTL
jgi:opacity protein-like surface antigen